jgi:hypothetical protein
MDFLDRNLPPGGPPGEREGMKFGFSGTFFCWSCSNPLVLLYLAAMAICTGLIKASSEVKDDKLRRLARFDERDDDRDRSRDRD